MNSIKAFPCTYTNPITGEEETNYGMSWRDYFAAKAMQAFIDSSEWQSTVGEISRNVAFNAYAMADAMMEARE